MFLGRIIGIFRLIIILTFVFSFINFTFLSGNFYTTIVNMIFSLGLLTVVKDPAGDLFRSLILLLENSERIE